MPMTIDECYRTLQLKRGATLEDIKHSFRRLAFTLHPDLNPDDPNASRKFQRLNEAYVHLKRLQATDQEEAAARARDRAKAGASGARADSTGRSTFQGHARQRPQHQGQAGRARRPESARADGFEYRQEEVLQDILKDPFARKVYEDIFKSAGRKRETAEGKGGDYRRPAAQPAPDKPAQVEEAVRKRQLSIEWGDRQLTFDLSQGILSGVKSWLKGQMDDEQTVYLPPSMLMPGKAIRIQIRRGLGSAPPVSVEVRLPSDFIIGRPVRLKGLGRQIGPLKGDLYLRLLTR